LYGLLSLQVTSTALVFVINVHLMCQYYMLFIILILLYIVDKITACLERQFMKSDGLQGYIQAEDLLQKGLSPTTDEIWLQRQC